MNLDQTKQRMDGAFDSLRKEFSGLRTGRASTSLLDNVQVEAYGSNMPLSQVGTVGVPEPRLLTVQVWDAGLVKNVEKAIRDAGLGLNPQPDGQLVRVPVPELSQERRQELAKIAGKYAETARIAVRNVRRDSLDAIKKLKLSEDETKGQSEKIQKLTDETIKKIDEALTAKEKDISHV
ncbi:MAG TPA: ribosome recycling factor [Alphaproteobacteria bacterium]|nr:ribosome recycling factor [Alphaproteobacteria bacterium]